MVQAQDTVAQLSRELEHLRSRLNEVEELRADLEEVKEALRNSETRFQAVTAFSEYAIVSISSENQIIFWSPGAERIFGYSKADVLGQPLSKVILDLHDPSELLATRTCGWPESPQAVGRAPEMKGLRKNGDEFPLELSLSSWTSKGEAFLSAIIRDISYRKNALTTLEIKSAEAEQKSEDLESLIQAVAHDLKSPVIAIAGLARRLQKCTDMLPPDPIRERLVSQIECGAQTIERFLTDLLDGLSLSKSDQHWTLVQLDTTIDEVVRQHEHEIAEQGIVVRVGIEHPLPAIIGNKHRLTQVLDNLLVNAIVHAGQRQNPMIRFECRCEKGFLLTSVSDNGTGIAPQHQGKIFERFFSSPDAADTKRGTGLGLFIAKQIVESHKGRIWVESEEGKGATFVFTLPLRSTAKGGDYQI